MLLVTFLSLYTVTYMCLCSPSSINWYRLRLGVKCTTGAVLGMYAGSHSADLAVGGQSAPLQHHSYLWLPLYSGLEVTSVTYAAI